MRKRERDCRDHPQIWCLRFPSHCSCAVFARGMKCWGADSTALLGRQPSLRGCGWPKASGGGLWRKSLLRSRRRSRRSIELLGKTKTPLLGVLVPVRGAG